MAQSRDPAQGIIEQFGSWDAVYRDMAPEELPWNAGGPDSELVRLVEAGTIPPGRALDLGAGPGHDAAFLAKKGFKVLALDISPKAIALARKTAKAAGVEKAVDFRVEDVLKLSSPEGSAAFVNDRGCFHVLAPADRARYLELIHRVLVPGGLLFLRTFSDQEPPGPGPHRFSRKELEELFAERFDMLELKDGIFEGPRKPKAYLCLLRKKP